MKIKELKKSCEITRKRGFDKIVCDIEDLEEIIRDFETLEADVITFVKQTYGGNKQLVKLHLDFMGIVYNE